MTLPVSVVVPTIPKRRQFLATRTLPAILKNDPAEILIIPQEGRASEKRNTGAAMAAQKYLYFCDDDVVLREGAFDRMIGILLDHPEASFVYGDIEHVTYPGTPAPFQGVFQAGPFDRDRLRGENYISAMSLLKREAFPGFDVAFEKFEDWDLWLTMVEAGCKGIYGGTVFHESHHIDKGLTMTADFESSMDRIRGKHGREPSQRGIHA